MATETPTYGRSIWSRPLDLFYIVFLAISVLLAFLLDFVPLFPFAVPEWYSTPRANFIKNINDPLYVLDPPFFKLFMWLEVVALVPGGLLCAWALIKDQKLTPLYLLVWSVYYTTSTAVCYVEMANAKDWPQEDLAKSKPGYILFGLVGFGMILDNYIRVNKIMLEKDAIFLEKNKTL